MWFASGLVKIYVPYASLLLSERVAGQEAIEWAKVNVPPPISLKGTPRSLDLEMRNGHPVWRVQDWEGKRLLVLCRQRGARVQDRRGLCGPRRLSLRQGDVLERPRDRERFNGLSRARSDHHRPLWKVSLSDEAGTHPYAPSSTGNTVLNTTRSERLWNWLGSVPHWLYHLASARGLVGLAAGCSVGPWPLHRRCRSLAS